MRHALKQTFSSLLFISFIGAGCASSNVTKNSTRAIRENTNQRVFYFPFDSVWRAAQLALRYPIAINNMDNGLLETDYIKAIDGFIPPNVEKKPSDGVRYKITLSLSRGRVDGKEAVRANISKSIERKRDFFSEPETIETDGLEEQVIFYRIQRELVVEEALKKAQAKGKL
jgi:hypothetical protein